MSEHKWIRTRKNRPCPICGRAGWCGVSEDKSLARCMRTPSDRPSPSRTGETGWIHRLTDAPPPPAPRAPRPALAGPPTMDWRAVHADYRARTRPDDVRRHAAQLGVTSISLYRLGIVWCGPYRAWGFPMVDLTGKACGIRLRAEDGSKWAITGSKQGLFMPEGRPAPGDPTLICEGPTDTAALLDLGFYAIGRPSCTGCGDWLGHMLAGSHVVIVGDRDEAKERPDGTKFFPGQEGAEQLADTLLLARAATVKVIYPLKGKDARAWKQAGATGAIVRAVINQRKNWTLRKDPHETDRQPRA